MAGRSGRLMRPLQACQGLRLVGLSSFPLEWRAGQWQIKDARHKGKPDDRT